MTVTYIQRGWALHRPPHLVEIGRSTLRRARENRWNLTRRGLLIQHGTDSHSHDKIGACHDIFLARLGRLFEFIDQGLVAADIAEEELFHDDSNRQC